MVNFATGGAQPDSKNEDFINKLLALPTCFVLQVRCYSKLHMPYFGNLFEIKLWKSQKRSNSLKSVINNPRVQKTHLSYQPDSLVLIFPATTYHLTLGIIQSDCCPRKCAEESYLLHISDTNLKELFLLKIYHEKYGV